MLELETLYIVAGLLVVLGIAFLIGAAIYIFAEGVFAVARRVVAKLAKRETTMGLLG